MNPLDILPVHPDVAYLHDMDVLDVARLKAAVSLAGKWMAAAISFKHSKPNDADVFSFGFDDPRHGIDLVIGKSQMEVRVDVEGAGRYGFAIPGTVTTPRSGREARRTIKAILGVYAWATNAPASSYSIRGGVDEAAERAVSASAAARISEGMGVAITFYEPRTPWRPAKAKDTGGVTIFNAKANARLFGQDPVCLPVVRMDRHYRIKTTAPDIRRTSSSRMDAMELLRIMHRESISPDELNPRAK
jgi:hypothetical protein